MVVNDNALNPMLNAAPRFLASMLAPTDRIRDISYCNGENTAGR